MIIPNGSDLQQLEFNTSSFSAFQVAQMTEIMQSDDFANASLCGNPDPDGDRRPGPYMFTWWTKSGKLQLKKLGVSRVLYETSV